jgi:hypothetical protein
MNTIVIKKSLLESANSILLSRPSFVSSISRVEILTNSVYFWFDNSRALSQASTCLYVAGILHRCVIR